MSFLERRSSIQMGLFRPGPTMFAVIESLQTAEKIAAVSDHLLNERGFLEIFHISTGFRTRITQLVQSQHGLAAKTHPDSRRLSIQYVKATDENMPLKKRVFSEVHSNGFDFTVIGVNDGMCPDVLESESDVSVRHLASTPIYVKRDSIVPTNDSVLRWVIVINESKQARHAFDTVLPLIREEAEVHLLYHNVLHGHKVVSDTSGGKELLNKYIEELETFGIDKIITYVSPEPRASKAIEAYCESLRKVHFLVVPTDHLHVDDPDKKLLGSTSDYCVKRLKCTVILPRCHDSIDDC